MNEKIVKLAAQKYKEGISQCKTREEISTYCQALCIVAIKTIYGIEGKRFKENFLSKAVKDNEMITPQKVQ